MAIEINIGLIDDEGKPSSTGCWLPDATTLAAAQTFAAAFAQLIDNMTEGKLTGINMIYHVALPGGLKANPIANSDVEQGAIFVYADAQNFKTSLRVAAVSKAKIVANSDAVDLADADVIALNLAMTAGIAGTQPSTNRGDDLTALLSAKESYKRQRR
jgi:hypothetical protein